MAERPNYKTAYINNVHSIGLNIIDKWGIIFQVLSLENIYHKHFVLY